MTFDPSSPPALLAFSAALVLILLGPTVGAYRAVILARAEARRLLAEAEAIRLRALREWQP